MKKTLILALIVGLIAASMAGPAVAKKKKKPKRIERQIELAYQAPSPGVPGAVGACLSGFAEGTACIDTPTGADDKYISVDVADASGQASYGILAQDTDADNPGLEIFATFCGATTEPIKIAQPGLTLRVSLYAGPSPDCPGVATTGTINGTLSNLP